MLHRGVVYCLAAMAAATCCVGAGCGDDAGMVDDAGEGAGDAARFTDAALPPGRDDAGGSTVADAGRLDGTGGELEDAGSDAGGLDAGADACCADRRPPLCADGLCDDGIACSIDRCNPITWLCEHVAPDRDGDGVGDSSCVGLEGRPLGGDCDDADPRAGYPDGPGFAGPGGCDGYDNDCDGTIDEGCECTLGETRVCGSTIGVCTLGVQRCLLGRWGEECFGAVAPSNEVCGDGRDDDCNGEVDDVSVTWLVDADGDGAGAEAMSGCAPPEHGTVPVGSPHDCEDGDPAIGPGVAEICNGRDDNCNGLEDEGLASWWYLDDDHDGFGLDGTAIFSCSPPTGYVPVGGDCEDDPIKFPDAPELCDGFNNDCDETVDEGCPCPVEGATRPCGRTGGSCTEGTQRCFHGVWLGLCEGGVRPGTEICNGLDDDCDGAIDEALTVPRLRDADGDGYGGVDQELVCPDAPGYADVGGDCDSSDPAVHPGVTAFQDHQRSAWPPWDYDCDGWEEPEYPSPRLVTCASGGDPCAHLGARWVESLGAGSVVSLAGCGETGTLRGCVEHPGGGCGIETLGTDVLQRCR